MQVIAWLKDHYATAVLQDGELNFDHFTINHFLAFVPAKQQDDNDWIRSPLGALSFPDVVLDPSPSDSICLDVALLLKIIAKSITNHFG